MKLIQIGLSQGVHRHSRSGLFLLLALVFPATGVMAQAQVVDVGQQATGNSSSDSNDIVLSLYLQLESLQGEVQTLRGLVEEQSYLIKRMQTESRDRYLDVDNRLSSLSNSSQAISVSPTPVQNGAIQPPQRSIDQQTEDLSPIVTTTVTTTAVTPTNTISNPVIVKPRNEQELYRTALNLMVEDSNYEDSISLFQQYIDTYPTGRYIANAYYWQGEGLIIVERYNQAKEVFTTVIDSYPEHAKAPGAMMKLLVTYINMGNSSQAQQTYQTLKSSYPDSATEISRAEDYLREAGI